MEKKTRGGVRDEAASIKKKIQEVERKGANLWWSPANRLCGPCVPAWRKLARHGKSTHTHTSIHTRPTQQLPRAVHLLNANTLYTHLYNTVQSLKSKHTVWLVCGFQAGFLCTFLLTLKCFDPEQGRANLKDVFVAARGQPNPDFVFSSLSPFMIHFQPP